MRLPRRHPPAAQFNMTPMIDVTFQLIIFFLLSSRLAQQESLELELPAAASGTPTAVEAGPMLSVNVTSAGRVYFDQTEILPGDMSRRLQLERDRQGAELEVRIRADRAVLYHFVEPILRACADAGIWKVTFAVFERAENQSPRVESQESRADSQSL